MEDDETYEAIYRIAKSLFVEYELTQVEGYITYLELARILNRFGYSTQSGGEFTESNGRAIGQTASAAWHYVERRYGSDEAHCIYWTIRDEHGNPHSDTTDRRSRSTR